MEALFAYQHLTAPDLGLRSGKLAMVKTVHEDVGG